MDDPSTTGEEADATDDPAGLVEAETAAERAAALDRLREASAADRKKTLQSFRAAAADDPSIASGVLPELAAFLGDDERPVRLTVAKAFVVVAEAEPGAVVPSVDALAERLADDEEFYYVRARCAEALGYVALERPEAVNSPDVLADLRIGLSFDAPEVREKLAKALECVALGDPDRLRHQVPTLADHLDDGTDLVRYHLCTALVAVGSTHPERLTDAVEPLVSRLADPNAYVRGRAAEALCAAAGGGEDLSVPTDSVTDLARSDEAFVAERASALAARLDCLDHDVEPPESTEAQEPEAPLGSVESVRETTEAAVREMTTPDADGECPHCGLELPEGGPPMCPRCGAPR